MKPPTNVGSSQSRGPDFSVIIVVLVQDIPTDAQEHLSRKSLYPGLIVQGLFMIPTYLLYYIIIYLNLSLIKIKTTTF